MERESRRRTSSGRSQGRSSDRSTSYRKSESGSRNRRTSQSSRSGSSYSYRTGSHRRRKGPDYRLIAIVGVILIVVIACIVFVVQATKSGEGTDASQESVTETAMEKQVTVDGVEITGMSRTEAEAAILAKYPWSMTVTYGEEVYQVADLMAEKVDSLLDEIYTGDPKESYSLDTTGLEEAIAAEAAAAAAKWDRSPRTDRFRALIKRAASSSSPERRPALP